MRKVYQEKNVYDATMERLNVVFQNFNKVYIAFSGGKDSGILFHLTMRYVKKHNIPIKVGVLFVDLEAFYKKTIEFVIEMMVEYKDYIEPYWVCLPLSTRNAVSMFQPYYTTWAKEEKEKWIRQMPNDVINLENHKFDFYKYGMSFEDFITDFGKWYSAGTETACLVAIRSDESLNRYRTIVSIEKETFQSLQWSTKIKNAKVFNFYPIYDWRTEDIWIANYKFSFKYNYIYDLFYKAGVPLSKMRICEPFGDEQRIGLNLYKILEPETWQKVANRVCGANFGNIYCGTKLLGYKQIKLPLNHTWKSYLKFLLSTLPEESKNNFIKKFKVYIKYWRKHGAVINKSDIVDELLNKGYLIEEKGISVRSVKGNKEYKFKKIYDDTDNISTSEELLSYKRMCFAILKNDFHCKTLGFSQTQEQIKRQKELLNKYQSL